MIVDDSASVKKVAEQIAWGKCINNGQSCVAPDYLIIHQNLKSSFIEHYAKTIQKFYGEDVKVSKDYGRIINEANFLRIKKLLDDALKQGANIRLGGETHAQERYMEPTLLDEIDMDMEIMHAEIFGPILPILTFRVIEEVPT